MTDTQEMIQILYGAGITTPDQLRRALESHNRRKDDLDRIRDQQADLIAELQEKNMDELALWASTIVAG